MKSILFFSFLILTPFMAYAQVKTFQSLPGLENVSDLSTQQYIDALYVIAIVAASILAVFKLMWAGVQYMLSEVVTSKQKAKDDIRGALLGLLIILGAVALLTTINPNLTNLNFLRNAKTIVPVEGGGGGGGNPAGRNLTPTNRNNECPAGQSNECSYDVNGNISNCVCVSVGV